MAQLHDRVLDHTARSMGMPVVVLAASVMVGASPEHAARSAQRRGIVTSWAWRMGPRPRA